MQLLYQGLPTVSIYGIFFLFGINIQKNIFRNEKLQYKLHKYVYIVTDFTFKPIDIYSNE